MSTSVIIVSYQTGSSLEECIKAVRSEALIDEIIIVDNGNEPDTRRWMDNQAQKDNTITIMQGHGNIGFAKACNAGAKTASCPYLLFLNPDAVLQGNALKELQNSLDAAAPGSVAGARLLNQDGSEQRGARRGRLTPWSALVSMTGLSHFAPVHPAFADMHQEKQPLPTTTVPVHAISGASLLMKRNDYERLGGFDERYFLHVEDLDLCRRVRKAGGHAMFVPTAEVVHYGSTSKANRLRVDWNKAIGLVRYFIKFSHSPIEKLGAWILSVPIIVAVMSRSAFTILRQHLS